MAITEAVLQELELLMQRQQDAADALNAAIEAQCEDDGTISKSVLKKAVTARFKDRVKKTVREAQQLQLILENSPQFVAEIKQKLAREGVVYQS